MRPQRKESMTVEEMFEVGRIMEWEDKSNNLKVLDDHDCQIVSKMLNGHKIINYPPYGA
jgi:hypothetical protein